jgi:hypothetical protein
MFDAENVNGRQYCTGIGGLWWRWRRYNDNNSATPTPAPVVPVTPPVSVFATEEATAIKDDATVYAVEDNKVIKAILSPKMAHIPLPM